MGQVEHRRVFARVTVGVDHLIIIKPTGVEDAPDLLRPDAIAIAITSSYLAVAWWKTSLAWAIQIVQSFETWLDKYKNVVAFVAAVAAVLGLLRQQLKSKEIANDAGTRRINRFTRLSLIHEVQERARVSDGLREAIRIDLKLSEASAAVPVNVQVLDGFQVKQRKGKATSGAIEQIFHDAGGRLLILGDPGTGKTNLLIELAQSLIAAAQNDVDYPIPILFSLARWTLGEKTRSLAEWMKDDLREIYDLTSADAQALIASDEIIPLLDGLDEVDEAKRSQCLEAINEYQQSRSRGCFAVCCRWEEYAWLLRNGHSESDSRISARVAIRVERLSRADVDREIGRPQLDHVRRALEADPVLRDFVDTPLWLHVLYLGALALPMPSKASNPRDRLYDQYVTHILQRRPERPRRIKTDSREMVSWLGWLAAEMQRRHQAQFLLETIDFSWLRGSSTVAAQTPPAPQKSTRGRGKKTKKAAQARPQIDTQPEVARKRITIAHRLMFGLAVGAAGALAGGPIFGLLAGVLAGLRLEGRVEAAERLHFDWRRAIRRWPFSLACGTIFALVFGWDHGLAGGLCVGLFAVSFEMLQGGFMPRSGDGGTVPNRATLRSARYALRVASIGVVVAATASFGAHTAASQHLISIATTGVIDDAAKLIAFAALILSGEKGGWFALRHYTARLLLWRKRRMPLAYTRFLNEAVERLFLIRRGGSYEFIHLTFRDYMAARYGVGPDRVEPSRIPVRTKTRMQHAGARLMLARRPLYGSEGV